jgi:hypothetical protein
MAIRTRFRRVQLPLLALAALVAAVAAAGTLGVSTASGAYPCNTHYAAPATCAIKGTLYIACSGVNLRYSLSTSSAVHGNPPPGTYYRYTGYSVGQNVNGSSYCLGVTSANWILTDSGWVSRTVAYIT